MAAVFMTRMAALIIKPLAKAVARAAEATVALQQLGIALAHRPASASVGAGMLQFSGFNKPACCCWLSKSKLRDREKGEARGCSP